GEKHGVDVDGHRIADALVPHPLPVDPANLEILQMVRDVVAGREGAAFACHACYLSPLRPFVRTSSPAIVASCAATKPANSAPAASGFTSTNTALNASTVNASFPASPIYAARNSAPAPASRR